MSPLLLETIKIQEGIISNLPYHQARCDRSRQHLFSSHSKLDLASHITAPSQGLYRCRILYHEKIHSIEYLPYQEKPIQKLQVVSSSITYPFKYANREQLNALLEANSHADEVMIAKNGLVTDTTISNLAFFDGNIWVTPKTPLLEGTMRAKLIDEGLLIPRDIEVSTLHTYTQVALINAMLGFKCLNDFTIFSEVGINDN